MNDLKRIQSDETKSVKERIQATEELGRIMQENLDEQLKIAEKELEIAGYKLNIEDGSTEALNAQAAALAKITEIQDQMKANEADQQKTIKTLRKQGANEAKERLQKELEARRVLEDSELKLMKEGLEKQRKETQTAYDRQIEDLKNKIATEKNLSAKAKEDLNSLILNLEKQKDVDLKRLEKENFNNEAQKTQERLSLRLSYLEQESKEALAIRKQQLERERELALEAAKEALIDEKLVNAKYDALIKQQDEDAKSAENAKLVAEEKRKLQEKLDLARLEGESVLAIKLEAKQKELDELARLESESDEQFKIRQLTLQQEVKEAEIAVSKEKEDQKKKELDSYTAMFDSIGTLMEDFGANSAALGAFSKALTLYDIGLNTAKALSSVVASAQSIPFPGNLLAVATTITTNISKAKKLLSSEKAPKAPKFASGGLVTGAGSGTSDSITAQLSNGESIITALGTQMFGPMLSAFNQIGGGAPIPLNSGTQQLQGKDMLTEAFKEAMKSMPSPVVSVQEINNTNKRVEVLESYGVL